MDTSGGCGASFEVAVVSQLFAGKALLARHRMVRLLDVGFDGSNFALTPPMRLLQVNDALKEELAEHIHALSIKKTKTPEQEAASAAY